MKIPMTLTLAFCSFCASILLGGCLTAGRKVLTLNLNPDGSGTGTMVFYNISSMQEGEEDNSLNDYSKLVDTWLYGENFETANPALENVKKRLYTQGKELNGEISFRFANYADIGLYRHKNSGPWMYYAQMNTSEIERFDSSNGEYGGESMPVIFWPEKTKQFTIINAFEAGERPVTSLYSHYQRLGAKQKSTKE